MPAARPPYHHGDLRRALLDAALSLLAETNHQEFSLREVARRAGVSHNAPYAHFTDKRALLAAVAASGFESLRACLLDAFAANADPGQINPASAGPTSAASARADPARALAAIGEAYVRFGTTNPACYRLMFGPVLAASKQVSPELATAADAAKAVLADVLRLGTASGAFGIDPHDPGSLALAVVTAWSLVHGLTMLHLDGLADKDGAPASLPSLAVSLFVRGLTR